VFVPIYFAVVGYRLDLTRTFSITMVIMVLVVACSVKLTSAGLAARLAGVAWRDSANLSIALNARGGPGIVLATVAYDAQIINAAFYTALVFLTVLTSQAAGAWLDYVVRKGWPLLSAPSASDLKAVSDSHANVRVAVILADEVGAGPTRSGEKLSGDRSLVTTASARECGWVSTAVTIRCAPRSPQFRRSACRVKSVSLSGRLY
jgi:hypothetical protein